MYLEISPRQSGKSARLLVAAQHHVAFNDGIAVIVTPTRSMSWHLYNRLPDYYMKRTDRFYFVQNPDMVRNLIARPSTKVFYDEFDFTPAENVIIDSDIYYATTPSFVRAVPLDADPLVQLLKLSKGEHIIVDRAGIYRTTVSRPKMFNNITELLKWYAENEGVFALEDYLLEKIKQNDILLEEVKKAAAEREAEDDDDYRYEHDEW